MNPGEQEGFMERVLAANAPGRARAF